MPKKNILRDEWQAVRRAQAALDGEGPWTSLAEAAVQFDIPVQTLITAANQNRLPALHVPALRERLPPDAAIRISGSADRLGEVVRSMGMNFAMALVVLFMLMAAMFRSLRDSAFVMATLPMAVLGGVAGLRVLDLSELLPGPYATSLLADLGAEVVKVERPGGDNARAIVPDMVEALNRGKRSICIDLKTEPGRAVLRQLAERSDVAVLLVAQDVPRAADL